MHRVPLPAPAKCIRFHRKTCVLLVLWGDESRLSLYELDSKLIERELNALEIGNYDTVGAAGDSVALQKTPSPILRYLSQNSAQQLDGFDADDGYWAGASKQELKDFFPSSQEYMTPSGQILHHCALSRSGRLVAACAGKGSLFVWEAFTGRLKINQNCKRKKKFEADPSPYSSCSASPERTVACWEPPEAQTIGWVAFSPNEEFVLAGWSDGRIRIWDAVSGIMKHRVLHEGLCLPLCFSHDANLVTGSARELRVWTLNSDGKAELHNMVALGIDTSTSTPLCLELGSCPGTAPRSIAVVGWKDYCIKVGGPFSYCDFAQKF